MDSCDNTGWMLSTHAARPSWWYPLRSDVPKTAAMPSQPATLGALLAAWPQPRPTAVSAASTPSRRPRGTIATSLEAWAALDDRLPTASQAAVATLDEEARAVHITAARQRYLKELAARMRIVLRPPDRP
jgi:hypothetical protein